MKIFEIGQRVTYKVVSKNNTYSVTAVVFEDKGSEVEVMTHLLGKKPHIQKVTVKKDILTKV
jgi:hypothetical protein